MVWTLTASTNLTIQMEPLVNSIIGWMSTMTLRMLQDFLQKAKGSRKRGKSLHLAMSIYKLIYSAPEGAPLLKRRKSH
jgi:hypothetical protein